MPWREVLNQVRPNNDLGPWLECTNSWFRALPAATKGHSGERLCIDYYPTAVANHGDGYDVEANEMRIECKVATRSYAQNNGYTWNQVRPLDNWSHLFLVAVDIEDTRVFLVPRDAVSVGDDALIRLYGLHHGADAMEQEQPICQIKTNAGNPIPEAFVQFEIDAPWQEILHGHQAIYAGQPNEMAWADSEFQWVRQIPTRTRGIMAENMYVNEYGGQRVANAGLGHDVLHDEKRIEVKLSSRTFANNGNAYQWNQIRPGDDYTHVFLVGIDIDSVRAFLMTKDICEQHSIPQHAGQEDTQMLVTSAVDPIPDWLLGLEVFPN